MTDRDAVRRGYDELAETYAAERTADSLEIDLLDGLLGRLDDDARVLDAGCGQGAPILARATEGTEAVGLDFSREQLRLAAGNAPDAELVQGDVTALPLGDGSFDAATAYHSLIHVPLTAHERVVAEFARVLRPDGFLLVTEGPGEWTGSNPNWLETGVEMQWAIAGADATREHLRAAGFAVVEEWTDDDELADDGHWVYFLARLDG